MGPCCSYYKRNQVIQLNEDLPPEGPMGEPAVSPHHNSMMGLAPPGGSPVQSNNWVDGGQGGGYNHGGDNGGYQEYGDNGNPNSEF